MDARAIRCSEAALGQAGLTSIAQVVDKLAEGDEALLSLEGFGRKSLIDLKKRLRARGFLPEAAEPASPTTALAHFSCEGAT